MQIKQAIQKRHMRRPNVFSQYYCVADVDALSIMILMSNKSHDVTRATSEDDVSISWKLALYVKFLPS